jgi:hypothetical protein
MGRHLKLLLLPALFASVLSAARPTPATELSGAWTGRITLVSTGLSLDGLVITLHQTGRQLEGTMLFPQPHALVPLSGKLTGSRLTLVSPPTKGLTVAITGRIRGPRRIAGTAVLDYDMASRGKRQDRTDFEMTR